MENQKTEDTSKKEKTYSQTELLTYCGVTGLVTAIVGYFIGETQGEKKSKEHFEYAVNRWKKKTDKEKEEQKEQEFVL
jgi:hypothetical protein